ncbi:hypothetical protein PTKIN_Ptkin01aG0296700 [Pterospermum kingtungense]
MFHGPAGIGGISRDSSSTALGKFSKSRGIADSSRDELLTVREVFPSSIHPIGLGAMSLKNVIGKWSLGHTREANAEVDVLAKANVDRVDDFVQIISC